MTRSWSLSLALLLACGCESQGDEGGSGGTAGSGAGGQPGGTGGVLQAGGSPGSGGASGGESGGSPGQCDPKTMTLAEYCGDPARCTLDRERICERIWFGSDWQVGCGYVTVTFWGDVGDRVTDTWDAESGSLVYHWFNGKLSAGCGTPLTVGAQPTCDSWAPACGSP